MRNFLIVLLVVGLAPFLFGDEVRFSTAKGPLRIAVAGMVHGHVEGILSQARQRDDLELVGVFEPNEALFQKLAAKYELSESLRFDDLGAMLDRCRPEAVSGMTSIKGHLAIVEACAPRGVHVLLEKPLAFSVADATRMAALSRKHGTLVLTNYETSWYAAVREVGRRVQAEPDNALRRMVFRHGHQGPREIGCGPEFLEWLTDPAENGGGALIDFGCYGAVLSTWLMEGARPEAVTAMVGNTKPDVYPKVDDDATILLRYPNASAVIQASWAWTHDLKEMDVFTERRSYHAGRGSALTVREAGQRAKSVQPPSMPPALANEWTYLRKVVRGETPVDPLSALPLNETVVWILEQARVQSASQRQNSPVEGRFEGESTPLDRGR